MSGFIRTRLSILLSLHVLGLTLTLKAKLLNITVDSVRKRRLRLRRKLDITLPDNNATLYEYLIENIH